MKRSKVTGIIDFPFLPREFWITGRLPEGGKPFCFPAIPNPMEFLSDADILRDMAGVTNLDSSPARFFKRPDDAPCRIDLDGWRSATPGHSGRRSVTGVVSAHPHATSL